MVTYPLEPESLLLFAGLCSEPEPFLPRRLVAFVAEHPHKNDPGRGSVHQKACLGGPKEPSEPYLG